MVNKAKLFVVLVVLGFFVSGAAASAIGWVNAHGNTPWGRYLSVNFGNGDSIPTKYWDLTAGANPPSYNGGGVVSVDTIHGTYLIVTGYGSDIGFSAYDFATHNRVWHSNIGGVQVGASIISADSSNIWVTINKDGVGPQLMRLDALTGVVQATATLPGLNRCFSANVDTYAYCVQENVIYRMDKTTLAILNQRAIDTVYADSYMWNTGGAAIATDGSRICTVSENRRQVQHQTYYSLKCFTSDLSSTMGPFGSYTVQNDDGRFRGMNAIAMGPDVVVWYGGVGLTGDKQIYACRISTQICMAYDTDAYANEIGIAADADNYYMWARKGDGSFASEIAAYPVSGIGGAGAPLWAFDGPGPDGGEFKVANDKIFISSTVYNKAGISVYSWVNPAGFAYYGSRLYAVATASDDGHLWVWDAGKTTADPATWNPFTGNYKNNGQAGITPSSWSLTASWTQNLGYPVYAPVIVGDNVYVGDAENPVNGDCEVQRYDVKTGVKYWAVAPFDFTCSNLPAPTASGDGVMAVNSEKSLYTVLESYNNLALPHTLCTNSYNSVGITSTSPLIIPGSNLIVIGTGSGWKGITYNKLGSDNNCHEIWSVSCSDNCNGHSCSAGGTADGDIPGYDGTYLYLPCIAKDTTFPNPNPYGTQAQLKVADLNGIVQWTWVDSASWGSPHTRILGAPIIDSNNQRIYMELWKTTMTGKMLAVNMQSSHNTIWTANVGGSLDLIPDLDYGFSYGNGKICAVSEFSVTCFDTSGFEIQSNDLNHGGNKPAISGDDLCIGSTDGMACWNMLSESSWGRNFFSNTPGKEGHAAAIGNTPTDPNTFNLIYTDSNGVMRRYYTSVAGMTTTTSTTSTTLPSGQNCFVVQDYDSPNALLDGVTVTMIDQTHPQSYPCTTSGGMCCINPPVSDSYQLTTSKAGYDELILPMESPFPTGAAMAAMKDYPLSNPTHLLLKIRQSSKEETYCRNDVPFYRYACWTVNPHPQSPYDITFNLLSSMDNYAVPIYSSTIKTTVDSRMSIYFNRPNCDDDIWYDYYAENPPCIKSFLHADLSVGCEMYSYPPYPAPCNPAKLFRTLDRTQSINPPPINYKLKVQFDAVASKVSTQKPMLECYQDSDCVNWWDPYASGNPSMCDLKRHSCSAGDQWGWIVDPPVTTYSNDRPVINIEFGQASICMDSSTPGCTRYDPSVIRYKVYRSSDGTTWKEVTTDYISYPSGDHKFQDKFTDICGVNSPTPQCASIIGTSYYYKVEAYVPVVGISYKKVSTLDPPSTPFYVENCDPDVSYKKCSAYTCLASSGGKGCGGFVECGTAKPCTTDTDCVGCQTKNGNNLISDTFCYSGTHTCKPKYKGCVDNTDCAAISEGNNGIWNRNPTNRLYCPTSGAPTMFCDKRRNAVLSTRIWPLHGDINYANQYTTAFCECKISDKDINDRACTGYDECQTGNCVTGGQAANPPSCSWTNLKNSADANYRTCYYQNAPTGNWCYNPTTSVSTGTCYAIGQCGSTDYIDCDINDPAKDDTYCRTTIFSRTGNNADKYYSFCEEVQGSSKGFCQPAAKRRDCGVQCMRTPWCIGGGTYTCQGASYPGYGTCQLPGGGCPTTTTTLPQNRQCNRNSQNCVNSQDYPVNPPAGTPHTTYYVVWRDVDYGGTTFHVPCFDGRGCPIKDSTTNQPATDATTGMYQYAACGCVELDSSNQLKTPSDSQYINKYICTPGDVLGSDKCVALLGDASQCDSTGAKNMGMPSGWSGDRVCAGFNCVGDSHTSDWIGQKQPPQCMPWRKQCILNAISSTPDADLWDPENYCHIEVGSKDEFGVHVWLGGPDDSPGGAIISGNAKSAKDNIKKNSQYCFTESRTQQQTPDFRCHAVKPDGADCYQDYECESQNCYMYSCANPNRKKKLLEPCLIYNQNVDTNPDLVWDSLNNGESSSTSSAPVWTDNCDNNDEASGPLYCDPCDQKLDLTDDGSSSSPKVKCDGLKIKDLAGGRCYHAQTNGEWCYSNDQCDQSTTGGTVTQMLTCGGTSSCDKGRGSGTPDVPTHDGTWINNFCSPTDQKTYNKHCIYTDVGQCYHDYIITGGSLDKFDQKQDEMCWRLQHLPGGNLPSTEDRFCSDSHMCKNAGEDDSLCKNCETFSASDRSSGKVIHCQGNCVINYCPKSTTSYLSTSCMRAPGYTGGHVASAGTSLDLSLVYCDGVGGKSTITSQGGMCHWRKEAGEKCQNKYECMAEYSCIGGICASKQCKSDSDCEAGQYCDSGTCRIKQTNAINIYAINGQSKPNPLTNEFKDAFDYVVSCNKADYVFRYESSVAIRMKYKVESGDEQWFGNTENMVTGAASGAIDLCKMKPDLISNTVEPSHNIFNVQFIPIIDGSPDYKIIPVKKVLVLARSLSLNVFRCDDVHMLTQSECKGFDLKGKPFNSNTFILKANNTIAIGQQGTNQAAYRDDVRTVKCYGGIEANTDYPNVLPPRTTDDETKGIWDGKSYLIVEDWMKSKYFKCYDMYGSINEGTLIFNPAEAIFNYQFDPRTRLFWILVVLIGIPTLVLAGTRARGR